MLKLTKCKVLQYVRQFCYQKQCIHCNSNIFVSKIFLIILLTCVNNPFLNYSIEKATKLLHKIEKK